MLRYLFMFIILTMFAYFFIDVVFIKAIQMSIITVVFAFSMDYLYKYKKKS